MENKFYHKSIDKPINVEPLNEPHKKQGLSVPSLQLILPTIGEQIISLPYAGEAPPPFAPFLIRKLPNTTLLVKDKTRQDIIWKLTPWEKAEKLANELANYAYLLSKQGEDIKWVQLLGVSGTDTYFARAYEYAPFGELPHFLRHSIRAGQALSVQTVRYILVQIADALAYLHKNNIVHRDLKAENILVFSDGIWPEVKLADFDRAIRLTPEEMLQEPVGSLFHMAPELLAWQPYDRRVDIYAFGMLIFELINGGARLWPQVATGLPDSLSAEEFAAQVVDKNLRPNWSYEDKDLQILAQNCLNGDPEKRPEFEEILAFLEHKPLRQQSTKRITSFTKRLSSNVAIAASKGNKRPTMEDAVCVLEQDEVKILCVFDGFNTARLSAFAAQSLALILADHVRQNVDVEGAIALAFATVQSKLGRLERILKAANDQKTQSAICGSTATVVVQAEGLLHLGFVGDSPAFLLGKQRLQPLINAHLPEREDERMRIEAVGGVVRRSTRMLDSGEEVAWGPLRVFTAQASPALGVTRALGVHALQLIIVAQPEFYEQKIHEEDKFLLLCSDGVANLLSIEMLQAFCFNAETPQIAAQQIIAEVERLGAPDNASVIIMPL